MVHRAARQLVRDGGRCAAGWSVRRAPRRVGRLRGIWRLRGVGRGLRRVGRLRRIRRRLRRVRGLGRVGLVACRPGWPVAALAPGLDPVHQGDGADAGGRGVAEGGDRIARGEGNADHRGADRSARDPAGDRLVLRHRCGGRGEDGAVGPSDPGRGHFGAEIRCGLLRLDREGLALLDRADTHDVHGEEAQREFGAFLRLYGVEDCLDDQDEDGEANDGGE